MLLYLLCSAAISELLVFELLWGCKKGKSLWPTHLPLELLYASKKVGGLEERPSLKVTVEFRLTSKNVTFELLIYKPPPVFEVRTDPVCELMTGGSPPVPELLLVTLNNLGVERSLLLSLKLLLPWLVAVNFPEDPMFRKLTFSLNEN